MSEQPFFHEGSESVRFWVPVGDKLVGAIVSKQTLHYRFQSRAVDDDPMNTFQVHRAQLELAVQRRVERGSIEPIMLRESDLPREPGESTGS